MGDHDQASEVPESCKNREAPENCEKNRNELLRNIPKVDRFMEAEPVKALCEQYGYQTVLEAARKAQEQLREVLQTGRYTELRLEEDCRENCGGECSAERKNPTVQRQKAPDHTEIFTAYLLKKVQEILFRQDQRRMQRVINATGVILHTNLGRAPLGEKLAEEIMPLMTGYTNLEMNLEDGKRGSRYDHFSENLCRLTGAEACLAVNNNAAAVLVMLTALASGGETIVSRGELVEIGGKFRIPDVCCQSGTTLVEVGTTNRHLSGRLPECGDGKYSRISQGSHQQLPDYRLHPRTSRGGACQGSPQPRNPLSGGPWKRMSCRYGSLWFAV